jgi:hypothetical protein
VIPLAKTPEQKVSSTQLLRGYVFLGSSLLVALVFIFTNRMVHKLDEQANTLSGILAHFFAVAAIPASQNQDIAPIYREVLAKVNFPVVVTDLDGRPYAWAGIGIAWTPSRTRVTLMDPKNPPPGAGRESWGSWAAGQEEPAAADPAGRDARRGTSTTEKSSLTRCAGSHHKCAIFLFMVWVVGSGAKVETGDTSGWAWQETAHQQDAISSLLGWL